MISEHCTAKDRNSQLDFHKHQFNKNVEFRRKFYFEMDLENYGSYSMGYSNYISHFFPFKYLYTNDRTPSFKNCQDFQKSSQLNCPFITVVFYIMQFGKLYIIFIFFSRCNYTSISSFQIFKDSILTSTLYALKCFAEYKLSTFI